MRFDTEPATPTAVLGVEPTQPISLIRCVAAVVEDEASDAGDDEAGEAELVRLGDYDVLGEIARGSMGGVFLAQARGGERRCALKVLEAPFSAHPDIVARLREELFISRRVRHPGLLEIHAFEEPAGADMPFLVMEYLDGETLGSLTDHGRLELDAAVALLAQVASAVAALHAAGIVHCDLKPDNIHVLYEAGLAGWPRTKVLDFGVARRLDAVVDDEPSIAGTPAYMAPEQWRGEAVTGSDVYALGCVLYELCTGETPFTGDTLRELMTAHLEALPMRAAVRRPDLRPELDRLISRMLAKDPALRPRMAEVTRVLTALAEASPSPVSPVQVELSGPLSGRIAWPLLSAG